MSATQSKYWLPETGPRSRGVVCLLASLLLAGCVNNADWIALENLPADESQPRQERQTASTWRSPSDESSSAQTERSTPPPPRQEENLPDVYRVRTGDTLYSISFRYSRDYREVAAANDISPPFTIVPGQELDMRASASTASSSRPSSSAPAPERSEQDNGTSDRQIAAAPITPPPADPSAVSSWIWPVEGNIVRTFSDGASGSKGIDIDAPLGESVRAAADGKVVYAGDGLRGYGNLIILEHPGRMLSAYAHTRVINVDEQQEVKQGDVIAEVGNRGDTPLLHFEIRQEGKPVDPMGYLPGR